ncbi:Oxoglutarate/iron-dependent dioxygenase [Penicillium paradoxum]|uniref:Oxoglutarate/iron-dependent dioxygenase n=1 Tax=Penicillium paradoxum TaxID=176176 RepID=UPI00254937F9|nr:Oxoglutarate/iron-dependent dioxygenase [Penicillium paradoxum]KAJ5782470.1 Oxoglutarate/iron-dependent dioxygenase [Penicillium paradoxum]
MASNPPQEFQPASTGVDKDDLKIPLIDFGPFFTGTPSDKHAVALAITEAFKTSGFVYLKSHGIPPSVVSDVFGSSSRFFARPQSEKDGLGWTTPQSNRGYVAIGREKLTTVDETDGVDNLRASAPDIKETMELGREGVEGLPNRWPDHLDDEGKDFKKTMLSFFEMGKNLHKHIMQAIALGMNLPEHFFDDFVSEGDNTLRLLHYPAVSKEVFQKNPNQVRAGEHSDYGSITLLFQDRLGGLQVRSPKGTFVNATPIADTIVVNAGDLLARWSNDTIKSTRHRVIQPPMPANEAENDPSGDYPARYSVAYFCNPNNNQVIEALPGTYGNDSHVEKKYPEILASEYLVQRLTATY